MSIDVAFQPKGPTTLVTNAAAIQVVSAGWGIALGPVSFRIVNLASTAQRLGYAPTAAVANAAGPSAAGVANAVFSINIEGNAVLTLELPANTYFIASTLTGFEITPGQGVTNG